MNKVLTLLYVVIKDNSVIAFKTNLKGFVELINDLISGTGSYGHFERRLKRMWHLNRKLMARLIISNHLKSRNMDPPGSI